MLPTTINVLPFPKPQKRHIKRNKSALRDIITCYVITSAPSSFESLPKRGIARQLSSITVYRAVASGSDNVPCSILCNNTRLKLCSSTGLRYISPSRIDLQVLWNLREGTWAPLCQINQTLDSQLKFVLVSRCHNLKSSSCRSMDHSWGFLS